MSDLSLDCLFHKARDGVCFYLTFDLTSSEKELMNSAWKPVRDGISMKHSTDSMSV